MAEQVACQLIVQLLPQIRSVHTDSLCINLSSSTQGGRERRLIHHGMSELHMGAIAPVWVHSMNGIARLFPLSLKEPRLFNT